MASDHYKDDRSIDRHIWPKYGIPLPLWLSNTPNSTSGVNKNEEINSVFERLRESRRLHPRNFLAAHININSYRYKFDEIKNFCLIKL
jgi:hypothetical protein